MTMLMVNYEDPHTGKIDTGLWVDTVVKGNGTFALVVTSKGDVEQAHISTLTVISNKKAQESKNTKVSPTGLGLVLQDQEQT